MGRLYKNLLYVPFPSSTRIDLSLRFLLSVHLTYAFSQSIKSKIAYATDTWTNRQMIYTFAGTIASFVDEEWNLVERVIDFRPLEDKEHEAFHAARSFISGAREMGSLNMMSFFFHSVNVHVLTSPHFSALATDNASVNDAIFRIASRYLLTLYGLPENNDRHIHCLAHIINLVVQDIMSGLDETDACLKDGGDTDHFLLHKDAPIHYTIDNDKDLSELESNRASDLNSTDSADDKLAAALDAKLRMVLESEGMDGADTEEPPAINELFEELSEVVTASELKRVWSSSSENSRALINYFSFASSSPRSPHRPSAARPSGSSQRPGLGSCCPIPKTRTCHRLPT
jgi:hypothetical protein